jgi:xylulose-5-phosphate/fructose-6-phosphate phosphoketolase
MWADRSGLRPLCRHASCRLPPPVKATIARALAADRPLARDAVGGAPDIPSVRGFWRAATYLAAAQLYLSTNCLLKEPLDAEHLKHPVLGHWGTSPGVCFFYAHLSDLARRTGRRIAFVVGPGHAAAAVLACAYLDGSLGETYPELGHGHRGLQSFVSRFAVPGGFESEISAAIPGTVYAGGELGPALSVAQGLALDSPELTVACVIGDGEFETGTAACAWQGGRLIDPGESGAVLPIIHLNGFRMGSQSLLGQCTERELHQFFLGSGYEPLFVGASHEQLALALTKAHDLLVSVSAGGSSRRRWPVLVVRTPKGWSGPKRWAGKPVEGGSRSHKAPFRSPSTDPSERVELERWLRSYRPGELFDRAGHPIPEALRCLPPRRARLGSTALTGTSAQRLALPALLDAAASNGAMEPRSSTEAVARYLARVIHADRGHRRFRIFSPDELSSNRLTAVLHETQLAAPTRHAPGELPTSRHGRVMEVLSEHLCVGWLEGYLQGGRHGIFATYESFAPITSSMVTQYLKFVAASQPLTWRAPRASLTFLLTSLCWNNCYTHQNPAFIDSLLCGEFPFVRVYTPSDASTAVAALRASLCSTDRMNVIVASKVPMPTWFDPSIAARAVASGYSAWPGAGVTGSEPVDVVLGTVGDRLCVEARQAIQILRARMPELSVRLVPVQEVTALGAPGYFEAASSDEYFAQHFTSGAPVHFAFTGHPGALKQLLFDRPHPERFTVAGFQISSAQATPFGLLMANKVDRFTLAAHVAARALVRRPELQTAVSRLERWTERQKASVAITGAPHARSSRA